MRANIMKPRLRRMMLGRQHINSYTPVTHAYALTYLAAAKKILSDPKPLGTWARMLGYAKLV